jgi:hypothetical protein
MKYTSTRYSRFCLSPTAALLLAAGSIAGDASTICAYRDPGAIRRIGEPALARPTPLSRRPNCPVAWANLRRLPLARFARALRIEPSCTTEARSSSLGIPSFSLQ